MDFLSGTHSVVSTLPQFFFIFLLRNPWNPYKASTSVGECEWWQSSLCRVQREGVIVVVEIGRCTTRCASDLNLKARLLRHFCNRWCTEHTNKACSEEKVCDGKASWVLLGEIPVPWTFLSDEGSKLWWKLYVEFRDDWSFLFGDLLSLTLPVTYLGEIYI